MKSRSGIYIGWVGFRNLGDEAMWDVCRNRYQSINWVTYDRLVGGPKVSRLIRGRKPLRHLYAALEQEIHTFGRTRHFIEIAKHKVIAGGSGTVGILGGGTIIEDSCYHAYVDVRRRTRSPIPVFGSGVQAPNFWSRYGEWKDSRYRWASILNELPAVGVRGPLSKALLEDAGANNVVVVGDPAVRYHRPMPRNKISPERFHIGLNCGDFGDKIWGDRDKLTEALVNLAKVLIGDGHFVTLIPVFPKDVGACEDIVRRVQAERCVIAPVLDSASTYISFVSALDLIVACRLHAGILASAANVPVLVLEYQPKCRDFALSIDWQDYVVRTDDVETGKLIELARHMLMNLPVLGSTLQVNVSRLSARFEQYCGRIEPLLIS